MGDENNSSVGRKWRRPTMAELQEAFGALVDWFTQTNPQVLDAYVCHLREQNPGITDDDLAWRIVHRKSFKAGLVGAATGLGGLIVLPVTVPAGLITCWRIQIFMAAAIGWVYSHAPDRNDLYLILAGDAAKEALKRLGIEVGKRLTRKAVERVITRQLMVKLWTILGRQIITKAGARSLISFVKMVPLVGAPIGFAFDWPATYMVGKTAIKYYSGQG